MIRLICSSTIVLKKRKLFCINGEIWRNWKYFSIIDVNKNETRTSIELFYDFSYLLFLKMDEIVSISIPFFLLWYLNQIFITINLSSIFDYIIISWMSICYAAVCQFVCTSIMFPPFVITVYMSLLD